MTPPRHSRHPARQPHTVTEHSSADIPASLITDRDLTRLDTLARHGVLTYRLTRTGYTIDTESYVGVLALDRIRLTLAPKMRISGEQIIDWLSYSLGVNPVQQSTSRGWQTSQRGLLDLAVAALIDECRQLIRSGLRRDYVPQDRIEPVLRGRLDLRAQATRRYGMIDQLHVRVHQRQPEVWENYVCHAALHAGARLTHNADISRTAVDLADAFPAHPGGRAHADQVLRRAAYHRMNAAYRPAHTWAQVILGAGGPSDLLREADLSTGSLLINMNQLWEGVVRRCVTDAITDLGGTVEPTRVDNALTITVDGAAKRLLRPDVLVRYPTTPPMIAAVDAKYKHATTQAISSNDLHQLLTYATAYPMPTPPRAMIVHPVDGSWTHRRVRVTGPRGLLGEILVVGADLRQPAREYRHQLRGHLNNLVPGRTGPDART